MVAIGECGLDYALLNYSSKEEQNIVFPLHFDLAEKYNLPMYFHSRDCEQDFLRILKQNRHKFPTAVVHSFTGSKTELKELLKMGLYIGKHRKIKLINFRCKWLFSQDRRKS